MDPGHLSIRDMSKREDNPDQRLTIDIIDTLNRLTIIEKRPLPKRRSH